MTAVVEQTGGPGAAASEPEAEQADYRALVRAWFAEHSTPRTGASFAGEGVDVERSRAWQRQLFEAGLAGVAWPRHYGGGGGAGWQEVVVRQEAARFADSADDVFGTAIGLVGPAILAHGDEGQRDRHLPPILAGQQVWCQLFSEPDAGSDLAALATRAVPDGDGWVVDGQKVWSSGAHLSDYGLLLARTGRPDDGPRGISCFILPMHEPGVDVRQLRQLTGAAHFCQVYLDQVRLAPDALLGTVGGGWTVTRTVLDAERTLIAAGGGIDLPVLQLAELAAAGRFDLTGSRRDQLVQAFIRARLIDWLSARLLERSRAAERAPGGPGAGASARSPEAAA
ncbi:MAG TPA: acyl-CoA dehydrogenase family protein, partial [Acidimicrobiales bacterium]|nr:acyl-CoA dehydrogenase family protein [Acidimicrobiales bacterium]